MSGNLHHKAIKRFDLDGTIYDESSLPRFKLEYTRILITELRISGYVPRLDIDPDFTISYNENTQSFDFKLSLYGIYVGKRQSEWILGLDGTLVVHHTPTSKSKESSRVQG
jgi:hypothetical protein